jgi:hypothetical protein
LLGWRRSVASAASWHLPLAKPGSWSRSCPTTRGLGSSSLSWRRSGVSRTTCRYPLAKASSSTLPIPAPGYAVAGRAEPSPQGDRCRVRAGALAPAAGPGPHPHPAPDAPCSPTGLLDAQEPDPVKPPPHQTIQIGVRPVIQRGRPAQGDSSVNQPHVWLYYSAGERARAIVHPLHRKYLTDRGWPQHPPMGHFAQARLTRNKPSARLRGTAPA